MSYSLDPKRKTPWMVIDMTTEEGMEGVYAGTYDDCQQYIAEQSECCSCFFYFLEILCFQVSLHRLSNKRLLFCSIQYPSVHH